MRKHIFQIFEGFHVTRLYLLLLPLFLSLATGCTFAGIGPYANDPFTGGVNASISTLLNVPLPAGMQRYPSHGFTTSSTSGGKQGLETFRGRVEEEHLISTMFNSLKASGWNLRLSLHKGDRAISLYQKANEYAILSFRRQGLLVIMEIWLGASLPNGASLPEAHEYSSVQSAPETNIVGEEYGPLEQNSDNGAIERWGGNSTLEERDL